MIVTAKASNSEEPGAVIPYAGTCEGAVGYLAVYLDSPKKQVSPSECHKS